MHTITIGIRNQDIGPIHELLVKDTLEGYGSYANEKGKEYMLSISTTKEIATWEKDFIITIYQQKKLVGFGRAKSDGWITHVFVDQNYQRQGYGDIILTKLEDYLYTASVEKFQLYSEPKVVGFYEKHKWEKSQEEPINYHNCLLIPMTKKRN